MNTHFFTIKFEDPKHAYCLSQNGSCLVCPHIVIAAVSHVNAVRIYLLNLTTECTRTCVYKMDQNLMSAAAVATTIIAICASEINPRKRRAGVRKRFQRRQALGCPLLRELRDFFMYFICKNESKNVLV